jgi:hypothetical protein
MKCALCQRPAPGDVAAMIDAGWLPCYFIGQQQQPGPVCPDCCSTRLRKAPDGEWEAIPPRAEAHRWN